MRWRPGAHARPRRRRFPGPHDILKSGCVCADEDGLRPAQRVLFLPLRRACEETPAQTAFSARIRKPRAERKERVVYFGCRIAPFLCLLISDKIQTSRMIRHPAPSNRGFFAPSRRRVSSWPPLRLAGLLARRFRSPVHDKYASGHNMTACPWKTHGVLW